MMLKAFTWMFKHEDFKQHVMYLIITSLALFIASFGIIFFVSDFLNSIFGTFTNKIIYTVLLILPVLFVQGYFWNLVAKIIDRREDVALGNVYGQKIEKKIIIELPEKNIFKHIWRGVASLVATVLSFLPYYLLLFATVIGGFIGLCFGAIPWITIVLYILYIVLLPMLCWNYGKTNSVFAMLDIFKGIRLLEDYPKNYILAVIMIIFTFTLNFGVDYLIVTIFGTNNIFQIIGILIGLLKGLYFLYVYAYIFGTIIPIQEF